MTPLAMWQSFVPVTSITPQPVRERPGSNPAMRSVAKSAPEKESLAPVSAKHGPKRNRQAALSFSMSASLIS